MSPTATKALEKLEREFARKWLEIRADPELSWERKKLKIREFGLKYDRERKEQQ